MSETDYFKLPPNFSYKYTYNIGNPIIIQLEWKIKFGPENNNPTRGPLCRVNNGSPTRAQYESILTYCTAIVGIPICNFTYFDFFIFFIFI